MLERNLKTRRNLALNVGILLIWRHHKAQMDEEEFMLRFNHIKFQENKDDPFSVAETRRKCLALNFFGSIHLHQENNLTNYLLSRDLASYADVVDDQSAEGVNNYSESVLAALPPNQFDNRRTWKTQLGSMRFEDLLDLPCIKDGKRSCIRGEIHENWVKDLKDAYNQCEDPPQNEERPSYFECVAAASQRCVKTRIPEQKKKVPEVNYNSDVEIDAKPKTEDPKWKGISFRTAREELYLQNLKKNRNNQGSSGNEGNYSSAPIKKSLGTRKGGVFNKFQPPTRSKDNHMEQVKEVESVEEEIDERLKNIDPKMVELIKSEIMDCGTKVTWDDIAGLELAKNTIQEIVVWPMLRPDIFTGLRRPPKGILLFGPPGTGKTLIGKCIASQSCSTFFSISASSLTSKWIGDGEKMVRALFAVARCHQPAVVFIDEIDSLLSQRSDTEHESSRRLKTEFLVQLDGAGTAEDDRILIIGATNRPQELDEAARRRLVKRLYIPLPDEKAREQIIHNLITKERHSLTNDQIHEISVLCKGYSGADVKNLCQEASLGPIRSISPQEIRNINPDEVRPLNVSDFKSALNRIKSSVSDGDLETYIKWDKQYGCGFGGF